MFPLCADAHGWRGFLSIPEHKRKRPGREAQGADPQGRDLSLDALGKSRQECCGQGQRGWNANTFRQKSSEISRPGVRMSLRALKHAPFLTPYEDLKAFAREARHNPTRCESLFWEAVRRKDKRNPLGVRVRQQQVLCGYIVDFYIAKWKLVIEIDGGYHQTQRQQAYDDRRNVWLIEHGYSVLRIPNRAVERQLPTVLRSIRKNFDPTYSTVRRELDPAGSKGRRPNPPG
jgi:very-short-patch-repair endonuclease